MRDTCVAVARCGAGCRTLSTKLHDQLGALPIALAGISAPALDNPEAMPANHLLEGLRRVTPSGDVEHRLLDPCVPHVAVLDQLRVEDLCGGVEAHTALITPEAYAINRGLPHAHLGYPLPLLPHALEAALGMKHVQDAGPLGARCARTHRNSLSTWASVSRS